MFFLLFQKLVCKVDQLVKRRAKSGLIKVKVDWDGAKEFVAQHLDKEIKVLNLRARKTEFLSTFRIRSPKNESFSHKKGTISNMSMMMS